jgi:hypothetical protein
MDIFKNVQKRKGEMLYEKIVLCDHNLKLASHHQKIIFQFVTVIFY